MGIYDIQKPLLREIVGDNSSTAEIYHTFIGDGQYEGRRALVKRNESGFLVELYLNNQRPLARHKLNYNLLRKIQVSI